MSTGAQGPATPVAVRPDVQVDAAQVAIVQWPSEAQRAAQLASDRRLRLYLVAPQSTPPVDWDGLSDWVRSPADAGDVYARIEALQRRNTGSVPEVKVTLDDDGILRRGKALVVLAPVEVPMFRTLLDRPGAVVSRNELMCGLGATGGEGNPSTVLNARMRRLREHVAPLGMRIVNVRQRGYFLEIHDV